MKVMDNSQPATLTITNKQIKVTDKIYHQPLKVADTMHNQLSHRQSVS